MTFAQRRRHAQVWTWLGTAIVLALVVMLVRRPPVPIQQPIETALPQGAPRGQAGQEQPERPK